MSDPTSPYDPTVGNPPPPPPASWDAPPAVPAPPAWGSPPPAAGWSNPPQAQPWNAPPPPYGGSLSSYGGPPIGYPEGYAPKSKVAAGLLGIFLGAFGVHNFYLGYTGKAIAQLLISVLSCGFLAIVSSIWGLVEGIMILTGSISTDAKGVPLAN